MAPRRRMSRVPRIVDCLHIGIVLLQISWGESGLQELLAHRSPLK